MMKRERDRQLFNSTINYSFKWKHGSRLYFAPPSNLQFIYNSLIQPHFDYCSVVRVIVVRPLVPNYKNYKIGRHEASVLRLQLYDSLFEI